MENMFKHHIHIEKAPSTFQQTDDRFQIQYGG